MEGTMSLQRVLPWLVLALFTSVIAMIVGAGRDQSWITGSAAAIFAALVIAIGLGLNQPLWRLDAYRITPEAAPVSAQCNAKLMALTWAWGAAAMAGVYTLGGLRWQHAWQYGSGMALIAVFTWFFGAAIARAERPAMRQMLLLRGLQLTIVQAVAAAGGVAYLLATGKLMSFRPDWAANQIFVAGGVAIVALSAMAIVTQRRLSKIGRKQPSGATGS
jgi:hypothetical protein